MNLVGLQYGPRTPPIGAAELVGMAPDVLFAVATPALEALSRETHSVPIVFVQVSDPVKLGFVASLARPGGNITGFANFEHPIAGKWLDLLKDTAPGRSRVAVLFDPNTPLSQTAYLRAIEAAAPSFRSQLTLADVRNAAEIERAINAFAQQPNGAVLVVPNALTILHRDLIIALAARHRLPAIYPYRLFVTSGGLISYGVDLPDLYRQAASYVDRILKGAKPGDLPVQLASKFELVVNLRAAKALGLTIPESPARRRRGDRMMGLFAAVHEFACGTERPNPMRWACPQLAKAEMEASKTGSGFDPLRNSGGPKCCDAQHGVSKDMVGCDPRLEGST